MIQGDSKLLVNQGVADTGAAVIYDTNHFNPVQFTEKLVSNIRAEKNKKIAEREKRNKALAATFENPYKGSLFQTQLLDEVKAAKQEFTKDPTLVYQLDDPTSALGQKMADWKLQIEANANIAKGAEDAYNKDLQIARAKDASGALDPLTFENLNNLSKMSYKDAAKWYQENGTAIVPAADIEDLLTQMTLQPHGVDVVVQSGQKIVTPLRDEAELDKEVNTILDNPANAKNVESQIRTYGSRDKLAEELKRRSKPESKITEVDKTSGGGEGSGPSIYKNVVSNFYHDANGDYGTDGEINSAKLSANGKSLAPYTYTDANGNTIFMQAAEVKRVGDEYVIFGNQATRTGEQKMTVKEATDKGYTASDWLGTGEKDDAGQEYVEIVEFKPTRVPLNDANNAALRAQTGKDFRNEFKRRNNSAGKSNGLIGRGETAKLEAAKDEESFKKSQKSIIEQIDAKIKEVEKKGGDENTKATIIKNLKSQKEKIQEKKFDKNSRTKQNASGSSSTTSVSKWDKNKRK